MSILLCAATTFEIQPAIDLIKEQGSDIDILITGVGLMQTSYALTKQVHARKPDFIIQAGIAGSFDPGLEIGEVVAINRDKPADLGVTENGKFLSVFDLKLSNPDEFPFTKGWLENHSQLISATSLKKVTAISVNEISTDMARIEDYKRSGASVESMEGAAMHYVALKENIPFMQLRSVSNYAGERDKTRWEIDLSIKNLNIELIKQLTELSA